MEKICDEVSTLTLTVLADSVNEHSAELSRIGLLS